MSDFIPVSVSSARPLLGFSDVHGCRHQAPASPGMDIRAEKSAVMARRVRVCFLLASVFLVMPAAAQTPGAELDEVSKPTASAGTKVSANEPHEVPKPANTSPILAVGLITLLRRRPNLPSGAVKPIDSRREESFIIDDSSSFSKDSVKVLDFGLWDLEADLRNYVPRTTTVYSPRKAKMQVPSIFKNPNISDRPEQSVERYSQRRPASGNPMTLKDLDFGLWDLEADLLSYAPRIMLESSLPKFLRSKKRWRSKRVRSGAATTSMALAAQNRYASLRLLPFPEQPSVHSPCKVKRQFPNSSPFAAIATSNPASLLSPAQEKLKDLWEEHMKCEFETKSVDDTVATMIEGGHVNHVPTMTGGVGLEGIRDFYTRFFIPQMPPDTKTTPVSRTIGETQIVEEMIFEFTHTVPMDWMLPGIAPTDKRVEVALVSIIGFCEGKVSHEHIYWDQASVLVQLGLLDARQLPVAGRESAAKVRDPGLPSNQLIQRAAGT